MSGKKPIFVAIVLVVLGVITGCSFTKSKSQIYDERVGRYIDSCALSIIESGKAENKVLDPAVVRRVCRCTLEYAFQHDSTFLEMTPEQRQDFQMRYIDSVWLRCGGEIYYLRFKNPRSKVRDTIPEKTE